MGDLVANILADPRLHSSQIVEGGQRTAVRRMEQQTTRDANVLSVQSIATGGPAEGNRQTTNLIVADRDYYFTLEILDSNGSPADARPLQRGAAYLVRARCTLNRNDTFGQKPVKIASKVYFFLECDPGDAQESAGGDAGCLPVGGALDWEHSFPLRVPAATQSGQAKLRLVYQEAQDTRVRNYAAELDVVFAASAAPAAAPRLELNVSQVAPEGTATLYVDRISAGQLQVHGFGAPPVKPQKRSVVVQPPELPAKFESALEYLEKLQERATSFSGDNPAQLGAWLEQLVKDLGPNGVLMIMESGESGVPWEMFRLTQGRYLGAQVKIVRWTPVEVDWSSLSVDWKETKVSGKLVAYLEQNDTMAARLGAVTNDIDDVQYEIGDESVLVYLGGKHGIYCTGEGAEIQRFWNPGGAPLRLPVEDVANRQNILVFADLPHSGQVLLCGANYVGVAKVILGRVGVGFVGTVAPLDREDAIEIAGEFLERAQKGGVSPAELLLELRKNAETVLRELGKIKDPQARRKAKRKALAAFAYVYYGGPGLRVEVQP